MELSFSFIIPVYNRPDEIKELLESLTKQVTTISFEVVIVEDGSTISSEEVVKTFQQQLQISYYYKENSGPGDSRNYGMRVAKGNYFIILDSDCIIPPQYVSEVAKSLQETYVDCFGGPDAAHDSFTTIQKAINYSMTSFFTTGGIRGSEKAVNKFQPRSFNMGISKAVFEKTGGFGKIHPGEDPDLTLRIWKAGFNTKLISTAYVFHKRRISWKKFYIQVHKFGLVRPILNEWHPDSKKITYWFPTVFLFGLVISIICSLLHFYLPIIVYVIYLTILFIDAILKNKNFKVAILAVFATLIQFYGYGKGFAKATLYVNFLKKNPQHIFPKLFFK
ncbi:glycosyltransferase [Zhouia sp. PK063]|uniref:glycosyltransferase n=1 Tax=Zhouia sp. PK063 TaxID=3373602 RepID=UPI0037B0A3AD